ncbi:DUF6944 family repetitive protein [Bacillus cereus]|uniref:DUF6944 family repetitive protein n=2 Tax=Bacillus cereus group TaxID=86661 RepID=UPI0009955BD5|nr:hypothetical protein [Bacillus cereus]MEB9553342.1 hypothetical protein [Bacillus cereus]MEB9566756.1 hypothetical protein [Bacillus cereus]OPA14501.1 hypothetical protein BHL54_11925 [Bacillus cereus]
MDDPIKEIVGAWFVAVGTIIAAIGSTPLKRLNSELRKDLNVWGNVLQATGNGLEADGQGEISLELIGNEIQSIGNVTVLTGLIIEFEDETQKKLVIAGNWIQALGGVTSIGGEIEDSSNIDESYNIVGNVLQATGNSLQAIGGIDELKASRDKVEGISEDDEDEDGQLIVITGSWIQAVGSVVSLIGQIREESQEIEENNS